jgi:hypothetical protein
MKFIEVSGDIVVDHVASVHHSWCAFLRELNPAIGTRGCAL